MNALVLSDSRHHAYGIPIEQIDVSNPQPQGEGSPSRSRSGVDRWPAPHDGDRKPTHDKVG